MNEQPEIQPNQGEAIVSAVKKKVLFFSNLEEYEKMEEVNEKIRNIAEELERKYPDARKCYLFHAMIGSSGIDRGKCTRFDFDGEDSIVKLVEDLYREYGGEEQ